MLTDLTNLEARVKELELERADVLAVLDGTSFDQGTLSERVADLLRCLHVTLEQWEMSDFHHFQARRKLLDDLLAIERYDGVRVLLPFPGPDCEDYATIELLDEWCTIHDVVAGAYPGATVRPADVDSPIVLGPGGELVPLIMAQVRELLSGHGFYGEVGDE